MGVAGGLIEAIEQVIVGAQPKASKPVDALAEIAAMRTDSRAPAWKHLEVAEVADRAKALIDSTGIAVQQGGLGLCGPAVFLRSWINRDPLAFAKFTHALYFDGKAKLGQKEIDPDDDLLNQDYPKVRKDLKAKSNDLDCPPTDWMVMGSLRDATNDAVDYEGTPGEDYAGGSDPWDLVGWLEATGIYSSVKWDPTVLHWDDLEELQALDPGLLKGRDVALSVNTALVREGDPDLWEMVRLISGLGGIHLPTPPNHMIELWSKVKPAANGQLRLDYWTWGKLRIGKTFPSQTVDNNYFGAVIAEI
jgi:hypothetical protein